MVSSIQGLAPITNPLNSVLVEKKLINVDQKFIQLVSLAEGLPRTQVISKKNLKFIKNRLIKISLID